MIALFLSLTLINGVCAQTVQTPSTYDTLWYASADPILGFNDAMIARSSNNHLQCLIGSAFYNNSGTENIYFHDPAASYLYSFYQISSSGLFQSVPDIAIGNSDGTCAFCISASTDYIAAIAYVYNSNVLIDLYDVYDDGNVVTVNATPVQTYTISGYVPHTVHIDAMPDGTTGPVGGLPNCSNFVVTWDDFSGASPNVYAAMGTFYSYAMSSVQLMNYSGSGINGYAPDVAGVQRSGLSGSDNLALVTYVDANGNKLYYQECDFSTGPTVSPTITTLDNGSTSSTFSVPRIDGYKTNNTSTTSLPSQYKVAAQVYNTTTSRYEIRTYDNYLATGPTNFPCSGVIDLSTVGGYSST